MSRWLTPFAADSGYAAPRQRREAAKVWGSEDVLPAQPLPLKPAVGTPLAKLAKKKKTGR